MASIIAAYALGTACFAACIAIAARDYAARKRERALQRRAKALGLVRPLPY